MSYLSHRASLSSPSRFQFPSSRRCTTVNIDGCRHCCFFGAQHTVWTCSQGILAAGLFAGDNYYPHGLNSSDDSLFDESFVRVYNSSSLQVKPQHPMQDSLFLSHPY